MLRNGSVNGNGKNSGHIFNLKNMLLLYLIFIQIHYYYCRFIAFASNYPLEHVTAGDLLERTPSGTVQVMTPSNQANTPQLSEPLKSDTMNTDAMVRPDDTEPGDADQDEQKSVDPLDKFLPPPPKAKCSEELQVGSVKIFLIIINR